MCDFTDQILKRHGYRQRLWMERESLPGRTLTLSLEEFIIPVCCGVEAGLKSITGGVPLRAGGVAPRWSDRDAIPLERGGAGVGHDGDAAIWRDFKRPWAAWVPALGDRSTGVRQAATLWRIKQVLHAR